MAINLRNNVQKQKLPLSNPMASFSNPVDDFLSPFQQTKKDLEGKIAEISSWQAPKSISQDINETNWSQFQGDNPNWPNYQHQSLIDYFRTGKTSSERIASWEIPSRTVPDSENPFKTPVKSSNPYEWAPWFVQSVGNFMFGTNPDDPTTSGLYKTAETIQGAGQAIFENQVEWGKQIADLAMQHSQNALNRWYSDLSPEKESKIKDYIRQKLDAGVSPDIIKEALAKAKSEWKLQWSWLDNPISGTLATIESWLSKWIAGLETGISNMWSAPLQEDTTSGLTRLTKWALETGLGSAQLATSVMPTTMWAKALIAPTVNTLFSTETAENVISPITEWIGTGIGMWQEALWYNPESSVSKDIQGIWSTAGTIALLWWAQKWGSKLYDYSAGKLSKWMESMYKRTGKKIPEQKPPVMDEWNNAISSEWVQWEIQAPGIIAGVQDKIFWDKNNVNLAGRAVSPRSTKQKSPNQKAEWDTKAYEWLQQLHDDSIAGRVDTDIGTMKWWAEWIEQGLDFWGKKIGEYTESDAKVPVTDIVWKLGEHMQNPLSNLSWPVKSIADAIIKVFSDPTYKDGMTISDIQQAMSDIKSQIYSDHKLVQSLSRETAGRWVNDFINTLNDRFQKAIDETSGNSIELQRAKQAYSRYKQIQGDFMQSLLVNNRNSKTGATGKAGIILGLYELSKGWAAAIPKVLALKYITGKMGEYGTRSWAYEKLIRNMDRQALQRAKGKYNTGDKSTLNLNNKKNDSWNSSNTDSTVPPEGTFQWWVEKVVQK